MNSTKLWMTAQTPSAFGMPISGGRAFGVSTDVCTAAATVVVRERETEAPAFDQVFGAPVSDSALRRSFRPVPFTADLGLLAERDIEVVETFLRRRWDLPDQARMWMAWRVAIPILYRLRLQYDAGTFTYEGFLEELLHRYRERNRFKK